jgi:hypothetical protein
MDNCNEIVNRKEMLFRKLTEIDLLGNNGEVQDSILIVNSIFLMKQKFEEHVDILKRISVEKFNSIIDYKEKFKIG